MESGKTLVEYLLDMSAEAAAAVNAQFVRDLVGVHERMRVKWRADPPSDARFAAMMGLKASTYAKAKRSVLEGGSPSLSRTSLAVIVLCDALPDDVRTGAFRLLWRARLSSPKPARCESPLFREALCSGRYLADLTKPIAASEYAASGLAETLGEERHAAGPRS